MKLNGEVQAGRSEDVERFFTNRVRTRCEHCSNLEGLQVKRMVKVGDRALMQGEGSRAKEPAFSQQGKGG